MINNVKIGSDPEFFISDGNKFIPSIGLIPGDKEEPYHMGNGFYIQKDNVLIEGNIPPANSKEEFVYNMRELKNLMNDYLRIIHPSLHIVCGDSAEYDMEELKQYPEAFVFGCQAYNNAWSNKTTKLLGFGESSKRSSGFHLHVGYDNPSERINKMIVKAFDFFVTTQARKIYNDDFRNYYYGELGSYRSKSYGVEMRSLGGYFAKDEYLPKVYDGVMQSLEYVNELILTNRMEMLEEATSVNEIKYDNSLVFIF